MQEIKDAVAALGAAEEAEAAARRAETEARNRTRAALDHVVSSFMALYGDLPMEARNKVRHAINAHATAEPIERAR